MVLGPTAWPFNDIVLKEAASISTPTAKAPASSAALKRLIISRLNSRGLKIGIPKPPWFLIASNPIRYFLGLAPSPTIPNVPHSKQPSRMALAYSFSSIPPARFVSIPVIGAAKTGSASLWPNNSIDVSGFLIL